MLRQSQRRLFLPGRIFPLLLIRRTIFPQILRKRFLLLFNILLYRRFGRPISYNAYRRRIIILKVIIIAKRIIFRTKVLMNIGLKITIFFLEPLLHNLQIDQKFIELLFLLHLHLYILLLNLLLLSKYINIIRIIKLISRTLQRIIQPISKIIILITIQIIIIIPLFITLLIIRRIILHKFQTLISVKRLRRTTPFPRIR